MGLSTKEILRSIHGCINLFPLGVIYFFPTDRDVSDFSKSRIKPLITENTCISEQAADTDEVGLKKVGKSFIYFRGMRSNIQMKSVPADKIVVDEMDEADPSACDMARKRMSHSAFKWESYLSNPTIPNYGIDAKYQESDQRSWLLKCPACGDWANPLDEFPENMVKQDDRFLMVCRKCGAALDKAAGEWVAKYPERLAVRGYQYSQLFSEFVSADDIMKEYLKAQETGRLNLFYNLTLGLAYVSAKEKLHKNDILELCSKDFPKNPFDEANSVFMGVDQGRDLHIVYKKKVGDKILTWFDVQKDFEALDKHMDNIAVCIIDALPETRKAREFAVRHRGKVYLNFYNANQKGSAKFDEQNLTVQENRTESLDASHEFFVSKANVLPPRNYPEIESFADHCSNIAKKLEEDDITGSKRYIWVKLGDDHYRHADNYATIALMSNRGGANIRWL